MSNKLISKLVKFFSWGVMGASVLVALVYFLRISGAAPDEEISVATSYINWAIILLGVTALLSVIFPLVNFLLNPQNIAKVLLGLGAMVAIVVVAYLLADTTPIVTAASAEVSDFSDPAVLKFADTGIISTYILLGVALLLLAYTGVRGIFNR